MNELHVGLAVLGVPLLLIGLIFLRRYRLAALVYLLAVVIGLGYLVTTGAVKDVGAEALKYINGEQPASAPAATESTPAPTPESTTPPAAAPAQPTPAPATPDTTTTPSTPESSTTPSTPDSSTTTPAPTTSAPSNEPAPSAPSDGTTPAPAPAP
jgi:hypothetical protein